VIYAVNYRQNQRNFGEKNGYFKSTSEKEKLVNRHSAPCISSYSRVAISDRQNRKNRIGVGKFSDRPEFGRQSRQILSAKSGNRQNRGIGKIGSRQKSADRQNRQIGKSRRKRPRGSLEKYARA
jgi:hypothetical protein